MNEVIRFINNFKNRSKNNDIIEVFSGECSYWFATILFRRFIRDGANIMYDSNECCFGTMINRRVYDISGDVTDNHRWKSWVSVSGRDKEQAINKYILL